MRSSTTNENLLNTNPHCRSTHFEDAQNSLEFFTPVDFGQTTQLSPELSFRFVRSAHILGAAMTEVTLKCDGQNRTLLFTGDIGRVHNDHTRTGESGLRRSYGGRIARRAGDGINLWQPGASS